jgi:hypothetical protein
VLTVAAAGIATATAVNGMWHVFGDALGLDGPGRVALVGFLEIALMTSAIRARSALLRRGRVGVDGAAVWVLALISAVLSAADADTPLARALRFTAPLVAAWMWDRGLAADRYSAARARAYPDAQSHEDVTWRWTTRRIAVRLGLADPRHRPGADIERARRLATLTRARLRLAILDTPTRHPWATLRPVRRAVAARRLQRHALSAVEHLSLGSDPAITSTITTTVAAVVGLADATDPAALPHTSADPWTRPRPDPLAHANGSARPIESASAATESDRLRLADLVSEPHRPDRRPAPVSQPGSTRTSDRIDQERATAPLPAAQNPDGSLAARPDDVTRLRQAIETGALGPAPTVDAVRRHLQISPNYARAARAAALTPAATTRPSQREETKPQEGEQETRRSARASEAGMHHSEAAENHMEKDPRNTRESESRQGTHAVRLAWALQDQQTMTADADLHYPRRSLAQ